MNDLILSFPDTSACRARTVDLRPFLGFGIDEIVSALATTLRVGLDAGQPAPTTLRNVVDNLRFHFFPWLQTAASVTNQPIGGADIDLALLENFSADLARQHAFTYARRIFICVTTGLRLAGRLGYVRPFEEVRPRRAFTDVARAYQSARPYSDHERRIILTALLKEIAKIRGGELSTQELTDAPVIYFLLIAFRTGFNATPLLTISRNALRPHPVRPDWQALVSFKARAGKEVPVPVKFSDVVDHLQIAENTTVALYNELLAFTAPWAKLADSAVRDRAFLRPPIEAKNNAKKNGSCTGRPVALTMLDVSKTLQSRLDQRHNLVGDDGRPLRFSAQRMRATLAARIDRLTNNDPFIKAELLGNTPQVASSSYSEPDAGAPLRFATALAELCQRLSSPLPANAKPTPAGGCTDTIHGRYAPKNGVTHCQRWLNCWCCPNQCLSGDENDLWRVYSFYWLLQSKARQLRQMPISGLFRFVIHVMETILPDRYGDAARRAKDRARTNPHPLWATVKTDELLFAETFDASP